MPSMRECYYCDALVEVRNGAVSKSNCTHQSKGTPSTRGGAKLAPRPSSPKDPNEWQYTEDGYAFEPGDRLYNYYDGEWGVVLEQGWQSEYWNGWFYLQYDDGNRVSLNSVRVSKNKP